MLNSLVPLFCDYIVCGGRLEKHTHTQDNYCNPCCTCVLTVNHGRWLRENGLAVQGQNIETFKVRIYKDYREKNNKGKKTGEQTYLE